MRYIYFVSYICSNPFMVGNGELSMTQEVTSIEHIKMMGDHIELQLPEMRTAPHIINFQLLRTEDAS